MADVRKVLFVCLHGAAKSVIAAHHLRRLADERGLALECESAGLEPDDAVPPPVIAGLRGDGIETAGARPERVTAELVNRADTVVSFGCDLSSLASPSTSVVRWEDVPHVSDGYDAARDEIVHRLHALLAEIETSDPTAR
jgi:arsenate reductase (thioredoxin)